MWRRVKRAGPVVILLFLAWEAAALWRAIVLGAIMFPPMIQYQAGEIAEIANLPLPFAIIGFTLIAVFFVVPVTALWIGWRAFRRWKRNIKSV